MLSELFHTLLEAMQESRKVRAVVFGALLVVCYFWGNWELALAIVLLWATYEAIHYLYDLWRGRK